MIKKIHIIKLLGGVILILGLIYVARAILATSSSANAYPIVVYQPTPITFTEAAASPQPYPMGYPTAIPFPTIPPPTPTIPWPEDPDSMAIKNTLLLYLKLRAEIPYTLDDSQLGEVLANDLRGGLIGGEGVNRAYLKAVQWHKNDTSIKSDGFGLLDYWQAVYAFDREVKRIYDSSADVRAILIYPRGESDTLLVTPSPLELARYQLEQLPEYQALKQASGLGAVIPGSRPDNVVPIEFTFEAITIDNDIAHVIGYFPYAKEELIFAKIDGRWYLINIILLENLV